ncbi:sensor histidine kinase [Salinimicrobium soli]|uniref:sensor histidine kinase n=1 Tax=Salinimicrobium soli TaxID=1254399 RepID=UPI003AABE927
MPSSRFQEYEDLNPPLSEEFHILKTAPKKDYTDILFLATQICESPIAILKVVEGDSSYVKAAVGIEAEDVPSDTNFWQVVLDEGDLLIVPDLSTDIRFSSKPFDNLTFFAAVPLFTPQGEKLGALLVFDHQEKVLDNNQKMALKILAEQVLNLVAFRKQNNELQRVQNNLEQKYSDLEKFASVVSHDIKSPLANIISLTDLLKEENKGNFDEETRQYLDFLSQASHSLRNYVDGLLIFYRSEKILEKEEEDVDLNSFFENIVKLYSVIPNVEITYPTYGHLEKVNKAALSQIFLNLISNALKYNHKEHRKVDVIFRPEEKFYFFEVRDNGDGIPKESLDHIFDLFATLDGNDRDGNPGSGIGLATVKKMVQHMGGDIEVESQPGEGSNFKFKIKRWS